MPMTVEYRNGVQSSTISYSNMVVPEGKANKIRKAFSKFYRRHFDIVSKYNVGLKTLLLEGLSEPEFYGDLVYKFRKIIGENDFLIIQKDNRSL